MSVLQTIQNGLLKSGTQETVAWIGTGGAVSVRAPWQAYLPGADNKKTDIAKAPFTITASRGSGVGGPVAGYWNANKAL